MFLIVYNLVGQKTLQCLSSILISDISIKILDRYMCIKYEGKCSTQNQIEAAIQNGNY